MPNPRAGATRTPLRLEPTVNDAVDLPIIIHIGTSIRRQNIPVGKLVPWNQPAALTDHIHPVMSGFHAVIASDYHERFPRLRFGYVEGGSTWVPATRVWRGWYWRPARPAM